MYAYTYIYTSRAHMHTFVKIVINWQIYIDTHTYINTCLHYLNTYTHTYMWTSTHLDALQTYAYIH